MSARLALVAFTTVLLLTACGGQEAVPVAANSSSTVLLPRTSSGTPAGALQNVAASFQANDIDGLLEATLPRTTYDNLRTTLTSPPPASDRDREEFATMVAQVTAPGAVDKVLAQAEPLLPMLKPQFQAGIAQMKAMLAMAPPEHQAQLTALVSGLETWADANAFDAAQLRTALTALTDALRKLDLSSLDALAELPYEQKMAKFGQLLAGLKQALRAFDVDVDQIVGSLKVEPVSEEGDHALVRTSIILFGAKIEGEAPMVKQDGYWLPAAALQFAEVYSLSYESYVARAHVSEAVNSAAAMKTAVAESHAANGKMPDAGQYDSAASPSHYVASAHHDETGKIIITLRDDGGVNPRVHNYQILLTPRLDDAQAQIIGWSCAAGAGLSPDFLPRSCR